MLKGEIQRFITYKLVEAREGNHLTQAQLSKLSGISQSKLSKIENGSIQIEASQLFILAKALKKTISYFFPKS
ncbi:MAG TPA: helix-turn-helix transcriptional regulator [Bacteroidia bacterium]|jgi:transcriptional regulator with XRE-family HTH domain|nr:helix-turn-helix transcriptional regulator [Bacteroidia bacterium]